LVKDENCDLFANSHNILNTWKNFFSELLNVNKASDVRQIEIYATEPSVPEVFMVMKLLLEIARY
jgi:hypothetical protein